MKQPSSLRTSWITDGPQYCPSFVPGHGDQFSLRIRKIYFKEYSLSYLWDVQNPCAVLMNLFLFHFEATLVVITVTISDLSFLLYLNWGNSMIKNPVRTPSLCLPHSFGFSLPLLSLPFFGVDLVGRIMYHFFHSQEKRRRRRHRIERGERGCFAVKCIRGEGL